MAPPAFTPPPPPYPAEFGPDVLDHSLAELEGLAVERGAYELGSVAWLARALVSPLRDLGPAELRRLLAHGRGTRWIVPLALARLEREPFTGGDYGPGDLLGAVLALGPDHSVWTPPRRAALARVLDGAHAAVATLAEPVRARVADDLEVARELFDDILPSPTAP